MTRPTEERRRNLMVLPEMQKRMIRRAALLPVGGLILVGGATALHCLRVLSEAAEHDIDLPGLRFLLPSVIGFVVVIAALVLRQASLMSNRVAGPAHRLIETMRAIREGHVPDHVQLRDQDYLREVADELNRVIDCIEADHEHDSGETWHPEHGKPVEIPTSRS